mmetsp:Transcript_17006/g.22026  ORF Transcript_17006/g.22026 Transcript_17006/m.22026 type:complete len:190 (+) Transcript_17006:314-883(+)
MNIIFRSLMCEKASSRTENLKFMYERLMTAVKCESKGFGIGDTSCRVRNYLAEYENLRHLLLDCKAPLIIDARRKVILDVLNAVKQYALNNSCVLQFRCSLVFLRDNSIRLFFLYDPAEEEYFIAERTFLLLTGRWDDELLQFMSSLVREEFFVVLFFLYVYNWRSLWRSWRAAALPYGTFDSLNVNSP